MAEPNLYELFRDLSDQINANHLDVCQRITALETTVSGLPQRVESLEGMRGKITGALAVVNVIITAAISLAVYLFKRH